MAQALAIETVPILGQPGVFVCNGCPCGEMSLELAAYGTTLAVAAKCPHMTLWIVDGELAEAETKGVRH